MLYNKINQMSASQDETIFNDFMFEIYDNDATANCYFDTKNILTY